MQFDKIYNQKLTTLMQSVQINDQSCTLSQRQQQESEVAGFVYKTFEILGVEEYQKIVYWSSNGLEFVIKDVVKFEQIVLPRYFRHKKMNSFVRQLNMYGFHKMKHNHFKSTFKHEHFQKDRADLLPLIKRKPKFNDKENEDTPEEPKPQELKPQKSSPYKMKQQQQTMTSQKWSNLSQEFLETTKMINMSLVKVTCNELSQIVNSIPEEEDCVSIEDDMEEEEDEGQQKKWEFQDPACFFASGFDLEPFN